MATIKTVLALQDAMTGPLKRINKAMNIMLNTLESVQKASGKAIDTKALQTARNELAKVNQELDDVDKKAKKAGSSVDGMSSKFAKIAAGLASIATIKKAIETSDSLTQATGRMKMLTGSDAGASQMNDAVYAMANRSRANYLDTANFVTNMGTNAGVGENGAFANTDELLRFSESVNKLFVISNASAEGQAAATLQLTQAMSSGVLRGEELNSVFEQAPKLIQTVADYLDVPLGTIRSMAAEGLITADVVKNAMLSSAKEIDAQFSEMPYTWSQIWNTASNALMRILTPLFNLISSVAQFVAENWSIIEPVLIGIAAAVGVLTAAWAAQTIAALIADGALKTVFATLLANPLTWIALAIGAVVAAIYKWVQSVGGLQNAWEICKLALLVAWNAIQYGFMTGVFAVVNFIETLILAWYNASTAIANYVGNLKVSVLTILQSMINGAIDIINKFINTVNKIPGVSIDAIEHVTFATTAAANEKAAQSARAEKLASKTAEIASARAERAATLNSLKSDLDSSVTALTSKYSAATSAAAGGGAADYAAETAANTASTAESAGSAASSLKDTTEDLKYLRDLAEQEAVNRFTTAEVKIDMTGMTNRISSDMDLDGVLRVLTDGFAEALTVAAEGVHA